MKTYSLFVKQEGRWIRLTGSAWSLKTARNVFQSGLLGGSLMGLEMGLRPAKEDLGNPKYKANMDRFFPPKA